MSIFNIIKRIIAPTKWRCENDPTEFSVSYGKENPDKTFFVIRRDYKGLGLFSIFISNIAWIKYAVDKGYIPIVDMQNYPNVYLEKKEEHRVNAWEKYFYQPMGYTLNDIKKSKNIIYSNMGVLDDRPSDSMSFFNDTDGELDAWKAICRKYVKVKDNILEKVECEWNNAFSEGDKVLGVLVRGTDYVKFKPQLHPVQPSSMQVIQKVKETVPNNFNKIYLCTEDASIIQDFKNEFGELVYLASREYIHYTGGRTPYTRVNRSNDTYLQGEEYLRQILLLSKCKNVVLARTSGTVGMALFSDKWEYSYVFDLGRYPIKQDKSDLIV